jgi:hypothetical protein
VVGSTIIATRDPNLLLEICSIEDLDDFICLELDRMITLDFEILATNCGVKWSESPPIVDNPNAGMAIFKIDETGLAYLLKHCVDQASEHQDDLDRLADFVRLYGLSNLYEVATF